MPISSSISIRGSVGRSGRNNDADVRMIQTRLNELMKPPRVALVVDGRSGPKTEGMITDFQKTVLGTKFPDARVDPNGQTQRALNDPVSEGKWAQMSMAPTPDAGGGSGGSQGRTLTYPRTATAQEKIALDLMFASAVQTRDPVALEVLDMMVRDENYSNFKNGMNALGAAQWAGELGQAIKGMRNFGMDARYIFWAFKEFAKYKDGKGLSEMLSFMKGRPELAKTLGRLGSAGRVLNVAAVLFCSIEVINHLDQGRPGAAIAEIYGTVMQIAVPWAGFVDAIQSVSFAYAPGLQGRPAVNYFFRLLNAINPIGAGKTAVDSVTTIIEVAIISFQKGSFASGKLELLVGRMKSTPMNVFVDWGETLGDYMGDKFGDFYYEHFLK